MSSSRDISLWHFGIFFNKINFNLLFTRLPNVNYLLFNFLFWVHIFLLKKKKINRIIWLRCPENSMLDCQDNQTIRNPVKPANHEALDAPHSLSLTSLPCFPLPPIITDTYSLTTLSVRFISKSCTVIGALRSGRNMVGKKNCVSK